MSVSAEDEKAIPFTVSLNDTGFAGKYSADDITRRFSQSVAKDIANHRAKKIPAAGYDKKKKKAYLEYADGHRDYV